LILSIISSALGGLLLLYIVYIIGNYIFVNPKINGSWVFEIETKQTDYNPYQDMMLRYTVVLIQEGLQLKGSGEKVFEKNKVKEIEYIGKDRSIIEVSGIINKNFFSKSNVEIHYKETNEVRESSSIHNVNIQDLNSMSGSFVSTIANQQGKAKWIRRTSS
jgi:hypothetical protein